MRRRSFLGITALAAVLIASSGTALAQGGGRGGRMMGGAGGGLGMLLIAEVQREIKMTPEQIAKVEAKQQEVRDAFQAAFPGGGGGGGAQITPEERQKRAAKQQELQSKAVGEILDATQLTRFRQLELQQQGALALARKEVATELKLTEDQIKQIAGIQSQLDTDRRAAFQGVDFQNMSDEERTKLMTKMQDLQKAAGAKVAALLTEAQATQWKTMQGTPFTFPAPTFGRRPAP